MLNFTPITMLSVGADFIHKVNEPDLQLTSTNFEQQMTCRMKGKK